MNKKEFIEKYGEEAWERKKEKNRIYNIEWRAKNQEKVKDSGRRFRETHPGYYSKYNKYIGKDAYIEKYGVEAWDRVLESARLWKTNNKSKHIESVKIWQENNPEKTSQYKKQYKITHPDATRAQSLLDAYRSTDKKEARGECTLTREWIVEHIFNSKCVYCGDSDWRHLGCDRIDNTLPHTPENCICSCGICNVERRDKWSVEEFKEWRKTHPRELNRNQRIEVVNGSLKKRNLV